MVSPQSRDATRAFDDDILLILFPLDAQEGTIARLKTRFPGLQVRWLNTKAPTGLLATADMPPEIWDGVTMICAHQIPDAKCLPQLRFVQLSSAGADHCKDNPLYEDGEKGVVFCTSNGAHP
jgi:hypothetical protein